MARKQLSNYFLRTIMATTAVSGDKGNKHYFLAYLTPVQAFPFQLSDSVCKYPEN